MKVSLVRKVLVAFVLVGLLLFGGVAHATNVSHARHPNLAAAQTFIERAIEKVTAAQEAHEFDLAGHAAAAKGYLDQAYGEIRQAATEANEQNQTP